MDDAVDFKLVLDQYNKQIAFLRDQSQKGLAVLLVFFAYYHSLTPPAGARPEAVHHLGRVQRGCIVVSVVPVVLFAVLQMTSRVRCEKAYRLLQTLAARDTPVGLDQLGILPGEPELAFWTWSGAFAVVYLAFLVINLFEPDTSLASAAALVLLGVLLRLAHRRIERLRQP